MPNRQTRPLHERISRRRIRDNVRRLRRQEIRNFVRYWYGFVPLVHCMAGSLTRLGFVATKATVARDYKALAFNPDEIAFHA